MTKIEELEQKLNEMERELKNTVNALEENLGGEISVLRDTLAELKESKKESKWKPKEKDKYWFVSCYGKADFGFWNNDSIDIWRYNTMPLFKEKRECEKYKRFMDTVKEKSYEFSKEEWEDIRINKHFIFYNYRNKELYIEEDTIGRDLDKIYFKTREDAQHIIDNFKDELMEYWI